MKRVAEFTSFVALTAFLTLAKPTTARADLPPNQTVRFLIRGTSDVVNSPIHLAVTLQLFAKDSDGNNQVAWIASNVVIEQRDNDGQVIETWNEVAPSFDIQDGAWWVTHSNVNAPDTSEFINPPHLAGLAASKIPNNAPLEYSIEGAEAQGGSPPFTTTAYLTHQFRISTEPVPIDEGDDEPVETDDGTDDPA